MFTKKNNKVLNNLGSLLIVTLLMSTFIPAMAEEESNEVGVVRGTYSSGTSIKWKDMEPTIFTSPRKEYKNLESITLDNTITYQQYEGMGISLDETSVSNIWKIEDPVQREEFIKQLVDPVTGAGFNIFRITIGSPDCIEHLPFWSYDELPEGVTEDWDLEYFTIEKDKNYHIIDTIKLIQKYNPNAVFYGSAWSAPAWMKTENRFTGYVEQKGSGYYQKNKLRDDCINVFAKYYVKFIQAYEAEGIPIRAITMLNEPGIDVVYPAMDISVDQQKLLAKEIKKEFANAGLETELWGHDFNWWDWKYQDINTKNYYRIFEDEETRAAIDALAFHPYWGNSDVMRQASDEYTIPVHITESNQFDSDTIIEWFEDSMSSYAGWCTITDERGGTLHWTDSRENDLDWNAVNPGWPNRLGIVYTNTQKTAFVGNFYAIGQFSKYLVNGAPGKPGAMRIGSTVSSGLKLPHVAFQNPDGEMVLVVANGSSRTIKLIMDGNEAIVKLPAGTVTLRWYPGVPDPVVVQDLGLNYLLSAEPKNFINPKSTLTYASLKFITIGVPLLLLVILRIRTQRRKREQ